MQGLRAGGLSELIDARAKEVFYKEFPIANSEKLEKTFGVNCLDAETRESTRKDMEWLRNRRQFYESEVGLAENLTLRSIARAVNTSSFHVSRILITLILIGLVTLVGIGASQNGWFKAVFR